MYQVSRYHPLLVTLHWVLAVLIVAALAIGFVGLAPTPNSDPQKIGALRVHMAGGMLILVLRNENTLDAARFYKTMTR